VLFAIQLGALGLIARAGAVGFGVINKDKRLDEINKTLNLKNIAHLGAQPDRHQ
jgi:hypothetical protein